MAYLTRLEAKQFVGGNASAREVCDWAAGLGGNVRSREQQGSFVDLAPTHGFGGEVQGLQIDTSAGALEAGPGDYLVHGIHGQFFIIAADEFAATYELEA